MTSVILLIAGIAMILAIGGRPRGAVGLFVACLVASVLWLIHHLTDSLPLAF
ncbi:hypothetical protein BH10PSE6_BH10PSE6_15700 [soil metagenome]